MLVTINTDASFSQEFKIGSYAFWIVCNSGRFLKSGSFREQVENPTLAEMKCIINALHCLKKQGWTGIDKIIINTDSLNGIHIFKKDKNHILKYRIKYGKSLSHKFDQVTKELPLIEFRHVKAHTTTEKARSWVNDWCDKAAKELLRKEVKNKKNEYRIIAARLAESGTLAGGN